MSGLASVTSNAAALDWLETAATAGGLPWEAGWRAKLDALLTWVARFSRKTNLVGDAAPGAIVAEHVIEALTVAAALADVCDPPRRLVDVGAGAGVEALTLALWAGDAHVLAVEPRRKRADFIELAADAMGIGRRVSVVRAQVPAWQASPLADVATSRATFAPARWLELGTALVKPGGYVVVHGRADDGWERSGDAVGRAVPGRPQHRVYAVRAAVLPESDPACGDL